MWLLLRTLAITLIIANGIIAQKNKQSGGIGKTDFEPSQTPQKNANERGDKEQSSSSADENSPPKLPGVAGQPINPGGFVFNGNQFGIPNPNQEPQVQPPVAPPNESRGEGIQPPSRTGEGISPVSRTGEGVPPPSRTGEGIPPPSRTGEGIPPPSRTGEGIPPPSRTAEGIPPPNRGEGISPPNKGENRNFQGPVNVPNVPNKGETPNLQGPANVPNAPTVVRNGPQIDGRKPIKTNNPTVSPLEPNEPLPAEHGRVPFTFRGQPTNFPKIADLDTPNTPSPSAVKPEEDLDTEHEIGNSHPADGRTEIGGSEFPNSRNTEPLVDQKNRGKGAGTLSQPKSTIKESVSKPEVDSSFANAINLKLTDLLKTLTASNIFTPEDLQNSSVQKNITDVFYNYTDKAFKERSTPTSAEELEKILQESADKVIQHFKADKKTAGNNQQPFNVGTRTNLGSSQQTSASNARGSPGQLDGSSSGAVSHLPLEPSENSGVILVTAHPPLTLNTDTAEEVDTSSDGGTKSGEIGDASSPPLFPNQSQNTPQGTSFPSRFNGNNPSIGKETSSLTNSKEKSPKIGSDSHIPTETPRIIFSNQEPATISFGNAPFAPVTRTNFGRTNVATQKPENVGVIIPNEGTETNAEENNSDILHVHSINRGTISPLHVKPTVPAEEPPTNSKESPFVVEPVETNNTPKFPPVVPVNTATIPPFVISSFNQNPSTGHPHPSDIDMHHDKSETSSETAINENANQNHPTVIISGNNNNTFYNVSSQSGKFQPNEFAPPNNNPGLNEEVFHVHTIAPLHFFEVTTTAEPSSQNISVLAIHPIHSQPHAVEHQNGSPPLFGTEEQQVNGSLEQPGKPLFPNMHTEEENAELSTDSRNFHTSFITRSPVIPLLPVHLNQSNFIPGRNSNNQNNNEFPSASTPFPQPPDWSAPDDESEPGVQPATQRTIGFGLPIANESFVTGPPGQHWTSSTIKEVLPPSSKPDDFTGSHEFTKSTEHEFTKSTEHELSSSKPEFVFPVSESSGFVNGSTNTSTESSLIIVHPGNVRPNFGEPSQELEPKNVSHSSNNATVPSVHLFEISTVTEEEEEAEEHTTKMTNHNETSTNHPLFPVIIGNGIHPVKETNLTSATQDHFRVTPFVLFNATMNETNHNFETSTSTNLLQFVNSSNHMHSLETSSSSSFELVTHEISFPQNSSIEPHASSTEMSHSEMHGIMLNNSTTILQNSTAEPSPVPEWSKSSLEPGFTKNESASHSESEWTKVTGVGTENETVATTPQQELITPKNKIATATWSLKLLDIEWDSGLNDKMSWQYKDLFGSIYPDLKQIFQELLKERFVEVTIKHFSQGSVIVNGQVDITEKIDNTRLNDDFDKALKNRGYQLGGHKVDPSTINVDHPGGSAPQVSNARPIGSNGVPGYVIGIIVAAIILALVVLAVGLLVRDPADIRRCLRRYRTRRLREDHYMVDEETMNGGNGAVKNWQQQNQQRPANGNGRDNYAAVNMYEMKDNPTNGTANPANAHTNYGYQTDGRPNGHSAPARHNNSNVAEIQLHGNQDIDEDSTRH